MASGTPVVTSNVSALPEVAGDAALLVDPYDPVAIAGAIHDVLTNDSLRRQLRQKGQQRASQFSWETSARRIRDIYWQIAQARAAVVATPTAAAAPAAAEREPGVPPS